MTRIVALGGTVNPGSSTEQALRLAASIAAADGAEVTVFGGEYLTALPHYLGPLHDPSQGAEMVAAVPDDVRRAIIASIPVGRLGDPAEIGEAVAYLASPRAAFCTGAVLTINGGQYIANG